MKAVVQRVKHAHVNIDGQTVGACEQGLMVLLGVAADDDEVDAHLLCQKLCKLRIFCDENDKMNLSVRDIGGSMLVVSQFTLLADTSHGNRPSFIGAGDPAHANALYERFVEIVAKGRGLDADKVREIADGRILSANDALECGLVAAIGHDEDARAALKELAGGDVRIMVYRSKTGFWSIFEDSIMFESSDDLIRKLESAVDRDATPRAEYRFR